MTKKKKECKNCKNFKDNCLHQFNVGILIKYRKESSFYIKKPEELNIDGSCINYAES